ncbi:MAG: calcium-binding protein [Elainellaceae cyanobacterium]
MTLSSSFRTLSSLNNQPQMLDNSFQQSEVSPSSMPEPDLSINPEDTPTAQPESDPPSSDLPGSGEIGDETSEAPEENAPTPFIPSEPGTIVVNPQDGLEAGEPNSIVGSQSGDRLSGTANADQIRARGGNDKLLGRAGDDQIVGGRGNDRLVGARGNDWLKGSAGDDRLIGGKGSDQLLGKNGDDTLLGGRGNDIIAGGKGSNVLSGQAGRDVFVLHRRGTSIIRDYQDSGDRIELPGSVRLGALEITQVGRSTEIELRNQTLAVLRNVDATDLSNADFI